MPCDREDQKRIARLLDDLKARRVLTNHQARAIGGSRAMARVNTLVHAGYAISVRRAGASTWLIELHEPDSQQTSQTPLDFSPTVSDGV